MQEIDPNKEKFVLSEIGGYAFRQFLRANSSRQKMKIKLLKIKGFKSIQSIELTDISPLMVLAGANGAGKSNFVETLLFLSQVIDPGVSKAVDYFGGVKNLIVPGKKSETISYR